MNDFPCKIFSLLQQDTAKASGIRYRVFPSKSLRGEASEVRYPIFFSKLSDKSFQSKPSSLPQHDTLDGFHHKLPSLPQVRHWCKILNNELAAYGSASQVSDPQQIGQKARNQT